MVKEREMASKSTAANRANASRSTGPRSAGGKARSAQNARRHGFAGARPLDGVAAKEIEVLARKLAGDAGDPECLFYARKAAEMAMMLGCICAARVNLINELLPQQSAAISCDTARPDAAAKSAPAGGNRCEPGSHCMTGYEDAEALVEVLPELLRLERYEAAALAARRRALLGLMRCRHDGAERLVHQRSR
jgi:hypothetical protein